MTEPTVTAVTVTYNSREVISSALQTTKEAFDAGLLDRHFVVDNHSRDGTAEFVRQEHPWATVVASQENLGFGRGCNIGIAQSRTPYVLLLNPDAALPAESLRRLVAFLEATPQAGIAAPAIRQPDGRLQFAGGLPTPNLVLSEALGKNTVSSVRRTIFPGQAPMRTNWVCGAVVLLRRSMLDEIGAFDPRYFLYFEETDLWFRAQQRGWELWTVGEAVASHVQAASARTSGSRMYAGCIAEHYFRSRFAYLAAHFGWPKAAATELAELGLMTANAARRAALGRGIEDYWVRVHSPLLGLPPPGDIR